MTLRVDARAIGLRRRPGDIAGWPEVQRDLAPTALRDDERRLYEATWREFRRELGLLGGSTRRPADWAAELRFRQKASLLRVTGMGDFAQALLEADQQLAISSVAFLETSSALAATLTGRGLARRRDQRQAGWRRQRNNADGLPDRQLDVVVFTVTESISLHRNEMPGGERERTLIVHDMRHSAIQLAQIEGRCHRDGEAAMIYFAYAERTVEEGIAATVTRRMASMEAMAGEDTSMLDEIAGVIDSVAAETALR